MGTDFKKILFATDLSDNCRYAFVYAANLAARYCAGITLLHVMEETPESLDLTIKGLLGRERWEMLHKQHEHDAMATLIGKKNESKVIYQALDALSEMAQNDNCQYAVENILIKDGNVVETILNTAQQEACDLIVISGNKALFSKTTSLKGKVKGILKRANIPVLVIPPMEK